MRTQHKLYLILCRPVTRSHLLTDRRSAPLAHIKFCSREFERAQHLGSDVKPCIIVSFNLSEHGEREILEFLALFIHFADDNMRQLLTRVLCYYWLLSLLLPATLTRYEYYYDRDMEASENGSEKIF